jgi:hypothetical protein
MKSRRRHSFDELFAQLPPHVQELARKAFQQWSKDHWHPSLRFKPVGDLPWSVRVGRDYRVLGIRVGDTIIWH